MGKIFGIFGSFIFCVIMLGIMPPILSDDDGVFYFCICLFLLIFGVLVMVGCLRSLINESEVENNKKTKSTSNELFVYVVNTQNNEYKISITDNFESIFTHLQKIYSHPKLICQKKFENNNDSHTFLHVLKIQFNKNKKIGDIFFLSNNDISKITNIFQKGFNGFNKPQEINEEYKQDEVKQKPQPKPSSVYLMFNPLNNTYKIGKANDVYKRLRTFQTGTPDIKLVTYKTYANEKQAFQMESMLHRQYQDNNYKKEWFNLNEEDVEFIKQTLS